MRTLILFVLINLCAAAACAQEVVITSGLSVQLLLDLKQRQREHENNGFVDMRSTQSFPPYLQYGGAMTFAISPRFRMGPSLYITSTAARSAYADYSGEMRIDQKLGCFGSAVYATFMLSTHEKGTLSLYALAGLDYTTLKVTEILRTQYTTSESEETYHAISPMQEIGFQYQWHLNSTWSVQFNGGIHIGVSMPLSNGNEDYAEVSWSGFKMLTGVAYRFKKI